MPVSSSLTPLDSAGEGRFVGHLAAELKKITGA